MSEVKRYGRIGDMVEATEGLLKLYPMMSVYVLASDLDRVTAERDAERRRADVAVADANDAEAAGKKVSELLATRTAERDAALAEISEIKESLAYRGSLLCRIERQRDALQQRLTAADERADVLEGLLLSAEVVIDQFMPNVGKCFGIDFLRLNDTLVAIKSALKTSGGSEYRKSCEGAHKALSMESQRIVAPGQFKCLACGDIHPGSGNLPCPKSSPTA